MTASRDCHVVMTTEDIKSQCDQKLKVSRLTDKETWYAEATKTDKEGYFIGKPPTDSPFWPHEFIGYLSESDWAAMTPEQKRTTEKKAAFCYLAVTDSVEPLFVMPCCEALSSGGKTEIAGLYIPISHRLLADQTLADEALHKTISSDLIHQFGHDWSSFTPEYEARTEIVLQWATQRGLHPLITLVILCCVTEGCITQFLASATRKDIDYEPALKRSIVHHARDEARHHRFFTDVFRLLFTQLDMACKPKYATLIPQFLRAFLDPDKKAARFVMEGVFDAAEIEQRIQATYPEEVVIHSVTQGGSHLARLSAEEGLFDLHGVKEAWIKAGLEAMIR